MMTPQKLNAILNDCQQQLDEKDTEIARLRAKGTEMISRLPREYVIVESMSASAIADRINNHIEQGWTLDHNVQTRSSHGSSSLYWAQLSKPI